MPTETLTLRRLNRATLARQLLLGRAEVSAVKAIGQLAGLQAQLARPPFVGLWTRLTDFRREALIRALQRRQVVRATMMRCTLHLVTSSDFTAHRRAMQPALDRALSSALRSRAPSSREQVVDAARRWFDERPRTFDALRDFFAGRFPEGDARAMAYALRCTLPLVQVPAESSWGFPAAADFAVAETLLGAALAEPNLETLVRWYLGAFGPASPADMQSWSGLPALKETFAAMRRELRAFRDPSGRELFDLPDAPRPHEDVPAPARFLPDYDNLVLGHADRTRLIADAHRRRILLANLRVLPTFLVDGFVAGTWSAVRKGARALLTVQPFGALAKKAKDALAEEAEALIRFVEPDARSFEVTFTHLKEASDGPVRGGGGRLRGDAGVGRSEDDRAGLQRRKRDLAGVRGVRRRAQG